MPGLESVGVGVFLLDRGAAQADSVGDPGEVAIHERAPGRGWREWNAASYRVPVREAGWVGSRRFVVMTAPTPTPSLRTILGIAFTGTGSGMTGLALWDQEPSGVMVGLGMLGIGLYISFTAQKRDRDNDASAE